MSDLQQFLIMMSTDVGDGISNKLFIEGDSETTYVSFFQGGINGKDVCDCIDKTNQEVTFMFDNKYGSFKGVEGALS